MSKIKVLANDKATGDSINGAISKVGMVPFPNEAHIIFLDDSGFACLKIGGEYSELRKLANALLHGISLLENERGVLQ